MNKFQEFLAGAGLILVCLCGTAVDGPNWHIAILVALFGLFLMSLSLLIEVIKCKKENTK